MNSTNIFRVIVLILGILAVTFDGLLYLSFEKQRDELDSIRDKQDVESEFNINKFKYQQDQIEHLSQDLEEVHQQIKDQKEALLAEIEKRKEVENEGKDVQNSLVDIKAEADAIKQYVQGWQKDYVTVLAQLEKKMGDSQDEIKNLEASITASINSLKADIEKMSHPSDNIISDTNPAPDKQVTNSQEATQ